jgi:hypothetical protein
VIVIFVVRCVRQKTKYKGVPACGGLAGVKPAATKPVVTSSGGLMPFIKGRFHINPIAGQALEAAREAEAALLALEHAAQQERQRQAIGDGDGVSAGEGDASNRDTGAPNEGPIHRVEIEASELVPSHQGRAVRGYVARVHRQPAAPGQPGSLTQHAMASRYSDAAQHDNNDEADPWNSGSAFGSRQSYGGSHGTLRRGSNAASPETHVFADHRDLVSFLRDELAKDSK